VLDSGPLGLLTNPVRSSEVKAMNLWVDQLVAASHRVVVPAIADYEVRRELERADKIKGLARLDAFNAAEPDRYLPLLDNALRLARNCGHRHGNRECQLLTGMPWTVMF